jgi:putative endonuclease
MALHNKRGKEGEEMAVRYLQERGYHVQHCNWRTSYYEIDIIATKEKMIHFIEVKTRHTNTFGYPEESITKKKFNNLKKAAEYFLYLNPYWKMIQFDVLSITRFNERPTEYFFIEDFYF